MKELKFETTMTACKRSLHLQIGKLSLSVGWYTGDPFKVFGVSFLEIPPDLDGFKVLFNIQVAYLAFSLCWR